ncbi:putative solute carrier family 46 member 3-like 8, partial [Homarus americanus]
MMDDRGDAPLLCDGVGSEHNCECLDSIDITNSAHFDGQTIGEEDNKKTECCRRVAQGLQGITVEPILFFNVLGLMVQSSLGTNLLLFKVNALWIELPSMYILLTAVPQALTGGFITLLMAAYSYMADITKFRARTMRIAFLDLGFGLASPIGLLLSDYLFYRLGYA